MESLLYPILFQLQIRTWKCQSYDSSEIQHDITTALVIKLLYPIF